ncbi:MAG: SGNH/GDSL hydrolase family protein [Bacteroidota bacterium]
MKTLRLILVNLAIFLVLLVIVDPLLPSQDGFIKTDRYVRLREPKPNLDYVFQFPDGDPLRFRTDRNGFYIGENSLENAIDAEIIFFGGSTTECSAVPEEKRFPYLIGENLINETSNSSIKTLNAGLSGNNVMHSLVSFIAKGIPEKPKIVFLMHNVNDLAQLLKTGSYWEAPKGRSVIVEEEKSSFYQRTKNYLKSTKDFFIPNTYSLVKKAVKSGSEGADEWENYRGGKLHPFDEVLTTYKRALKSFVKVAKANDIPVVLMTQFNRFSPEDQEIRQQFQQMFKGIEFELFCKYYEEFNNCIRQVAIEESVEMIDLEAKVRPAKAYLTDFVHLNENGSILVSKEISVWLIENYPQYKLK